MTLGERPRQPEAPPAAGECFSRLLERWPRGALAPSETHSSGVATAFVAIFEEKRGSSEHYRMLATCRSLFLLALYFPLQRFEWPGKLQAFTARKEFRRGATRDQSRRCPAPVQAARRAAGGLRALLVTVSQRLVSCCFCQFFTFDSFLSRGSFSDSFPAITVSE